MFKLFVFAALAAVAVAQLPFSRFGSPLGFRSGLIDPYYGGYGPYYGRGLLGGDYYNRGYYGGDYYNRGFLGRGLLGGYYGGSPYYRGVPAAIPPVFRRPAVIPPAVIPPVVRAPIATAEGRARIVSQSNDATADGAYQYHYETENGIVAGEQNIPKVLPTGEVVNAVQGTYSYVAPNGEQVAVSYVADENGFQPQLHDDARIASAARLAPVVTPAPASK